MFSISERTGNAVGAVVLFVVGAFWALEAYRMPAGEYSVPGPGAFPLFLATGLCLAAAGLAVQAWRRQPLGPSAQVGHRSIWATLGAILVLAFLFERVGFLWSMSLFLGFLLRMLSQHRWATIIPAAIAGAMVAYVFFGSILGLRLPPSPWP